MSDFHFIRPEWFFALIPLIWMLWQLNRQKLGNHGWQQIIPQHLVKHLMQGQNATKHQPFWLLAIIWLIVVTALAGPAWEKLPQPVYQTNTGKVLVMDMSQSMLATDLTPNRLTKARFKAIDLIDKIDDADMGLIAYSGDAFVISPLTADSKNLTALIPSLSPNIMPLIGSNAYAALDLADELLKNAGYSKGEIYWITDGIDQSELNDIRELLSVSKHRVSILGVGTPQGAPIKQTSGELLKDGRGSIIIPKLNDSNLRTIAKATDGAYTRITSTAIDIETLAQQELISREAKKEQDEQLHQGDQFREFGPLMVMLILPFAAYAFRRGLVFVFLLFSSSLLISAPTPVLAQNAATNSPTNAPTPAAQAQAAASQPTASETPSWWNNMWQTQDQQAAKQFDQQNYSDAAQMFDNNQWKGSSLYKSGDYEGALKEFQQSNDANGLYNQGNAHAQMQNFDEAIKAYEKALAQNPDMEDAKKNLELIKQMQQQQQQQQDQQNQDGENQDGENQENQDQEQQQNQDQQSEGSEQEQQSEQDQQGDQDQQQEQQNGQEGEQDDTQPREQEQQQGDQDPRAQQKEQPEEQSVPGEEREGEEGEEKGEQQVKPSEAQTTEEKEQMQEIQQLIRKINDDPSVLLRNKMQLEYQKRKYQNSSPPGAKSW